MKNIAIKRSKWPENLGELYTGIDAGSVSLNCIVINDKKEIVYEFPYQRHLGKVEEGVLSLIRSLYQKFGEDRIRSVSFTGSHGRNLSEKLGAFYEFETISQVLGAIFVKPDVKTIISMGGQDTALFQINHMGSGDGWELEYFNTNGPCASGTGSFIDQQAQRLATSMYAEKRISPRIRSTGSWLTLSDSGLKSEKPANVACRCTVFTKSDMIHLQNKGEKTGGYHLRSARGKCQKLHEHHRLQSGA